MTSRSVVVVKRLPSSSQARVLVIGDVHVRDRNGPATNALTRLAAAAVEDLRPDAVVVLGDLLHNHDSVNLHALQRAVGFLSALRNAIDSTMTKERRHIVGVGQLVLLIGNHDRPNNATFLTEEHPFTAVARWPRTTVVEAPRLLSVCGVQMLLVPYVAPGRFREALGGNETWWMSSSDAQPTTIACVFAHQEFRGCHLAGGIVSRAGDEYPTAAPFCISGHIHRRHRLAPNVLYPGEPLPKGEANAIAHLFTISSAGGEPKELTIVLGRVPVDRTVRFASVADFLAIAADTDDHLAVLAAGGLKADDANTAQTIRVLIGGNGDRCDIAAAAASRGALALAANGVTLQIATAANEKHTTAADEDGGGSASASSMTLLPPSSAMRPFSQCIEAYVETAPPEAAAFVRELFTPSPPSASSSSLAEKQDD